MTDPGEWTRSYKNLKYSVKSPRYGDRVEIWVREDPAGVSRWSRSVCLKECWWHIGSPKTRLENAYYKASKVADKLTDKARYVNSDFNLFHERFIDK